jgi:hypothetical protein
VGRSMTRSSSCSSRTMWWSTESGGMLLARRSTGLFVGRLRRLTTCRSLHPPSSPSPAAMLARTLRRRKGFVRDCRIVLEYKMCDRTGFEAHCLHTQLLQSASRSTMRAGLRP